MLKNGIRLALVALLLALLLVLAPSPVSMFGAQAAVVELPIDKSGGLEYDWANYLSDTEYEDPSLSVKITWGGRIYDTNYVYAVAKIANATQLRTSMAYRYNSDYTTPGHKMAKACNAVLAINGDFFNYYDHGYLVRHGNVYRSRPKTGWDMLIIDQNGDFHTLIDPNKKKLEEWMANNPEVTIINSFNFGPVLIENGEARSLEELLDNNSFGPKKQCQRMAFCQLDALTYLCVTSEGPEDKGSAGLTLEQFVECLQQIDEQLTDYTIKTAYNLDGGSSATMVFQNKKINAPTNPKVRYLCDIIYFASAWQAE